MMNDNSSKNHNQIQQELAEKFPKIISEIDKTVAKIANLISQLPSEQLLGRASQEFMAKSFGTRPESEVGFEQSHALRMVDYLQSVIVSVKPKIPQKSKISENDWDKLKKLVENLFNTINMDYQICRTAFNKINKQNYDDDWEDFYYMAQMCWCNIRMQRYHCHQKEYFTNLLSPHSEILFELFNITAHELIKQIIKIQEVFTVGFRDACIDMQRIYNEINKKEFIVKSKNKDANIQNLIEACGLKKECQDAFNRIFGLDLYKLKKISALPEKLLKELSWEPGQNQDFFSDGEFKGWPLRIWPIFSRPFIKINNEYYCFELTSLLDNIYRVLQKTICRLKPEYSSIWNNKQKEIAEQLPLKYLEKILNGAKIYSNVFYKWYPKSDSKNKEWCETDCLLLYDGYLFIIEVRAGAFTYTPPATDFPAYIESIKNLIWKPYTQGLRFSNYLSNSNKIDIFDEKHNKIAELTKNNLRHIIVCAVTLDHFTELAAQANHLRNDNKHSVPVWSLSIDDLRTYADIFSNPLSFLHFVEQRIKACASNTLRLNDELDHLGLYFKHNHYVTYEKEMLTQNNADRINFGGYRTDIDKFFAEKQINPDVSCFLKQSLPFHLEEIIDFLQTSKKQERSKISSYLLDFNSEYRNKIDAYIDLVLTKQQEQRVICPFHIHGESSLTVICWHNNVKKRDNAFAIQHAKSEMLIKKNDNHVLLELVYSEENKLVDVHWCDVTLDNVTINEKLKLQRQVDYLKKQRLTKAQQIQGKIGRNSTCPCGSGKKYKKCCYLL
jgi:hypothetical protein